MWVTSADGTITTGSLTLASVVPALFSANGSGTGGAAATWLRVAADGTQTSGILNGPLNLGATTDRTYLTLYGTGIANGGGAAKTTATIGGATAQVLYAGTQSQYPGLDQVNVEVPQALRGKGTANLQVAVAGQAANVVTITVQ